MTEIARTRDVNQAALERTCVAEQIEETNRRGRTAITNKEEIPFDEGEGTNEVESFLRPRESSNEENSSGNDQHQKSPSIGPKKPMHSSTGRESKECIGTMDKGNSLHRVPQRAPVPSQDQP